MLAEARVTEVRKTLHALSADNNEEVQRAAELGLELAELLDDINDELAELQEEQRRMYQFTPNLKDRFDTTLSNAIRDAVKVDRAEDGTLTATFRGTLRFPTVPIAQGPADFVNRAVDNFVDHLADFIRGLL